MQFVQEAERFAEHLQSLYFEERDASQLIDEMSENATLIGTGRQELYHARAQIERALMRELTIYEDGFILTGSDLCTQPISDTVCLVYGEIRAQAKNASVEDLQYRVTLVCVNTEAGIKLAHLHISNADAMQEDNQFFTARGHSNSAMRERTAQAMRELQRCNSEIAALSAHISGGIHQCLLDEKITLVSIGAGFEALTGYTPQEIHDRFQDSYIALVIPSDVDDLRRALSRQLVLGDSVELEYSIRRADGRIICVSDRSKIVMQSDGTPTLYSILVDITEQRREREALRLSLERHEIIMNQTTDIIFEWNIMDDHMVFSSNWRERFGYSPSQDNMTEGEGYFRDIHPQDQGLYLKLAQNTRDGIPYSDIELRIRCADDSYKWSRVRTTTQFDHEGKPIKAVGVILDVDAEVRQRRELQARAEQDQMTGLLNRTTMEERVSEIVKSKRVARGALFIIDLDNFKQINDRFGHLCGDTAITAAADELKRLFRSSDIVGRIGGDEYLAFAGGMTAERARTKSAEICRAFRDIHYYENQETLSCSVGVAIFPQHGQDFRKLYHSADCALYCVKSHHKGESAVYADGMQKKLK